MKVRSTFCLLILFVLVKIARQLVKEETTNISSRDVFSLDISHLDEVVSTLKEHHYSISTYIDLCLSLGLFKENIETIEANFKLDIQIRFQECIAKWLKRVDNVDKKGGANWKTLINALRRINENAIAEKLCEKKHPSGIKLASSQHNIIKHASIIIDKLRQENIMPFSHTIKDAPELLYVLKKFVCDSNDHSNLEKLAHVLPCPLNMNNIESDDNGIISQRPIPKKESKKFTELRVKFGTMFSEVREQISEQMWSENLLTELKIFLGDCFDQWKLRLKDSKTIKEVIDLVKEKTTLLDFKILKGIVNKYDLKKAKTSIQDYEMYLTIFMENTTAKYCYSIDFEIGRRTLHPLVTIVFILDWDADEYTLKDVKELVADCFESDVAIKVIKKTNSIKVVCSFSACQTQVLIKRSFKKLNLLKRRGLMKLSIGYITVYNKCNSVAPELDKKAEYGTAISPTSNSNFCEVKTSFSSIITVVTIYVVIMASLTLINVLIYVSKKPQDSAEYKKRTRLFEGDVQWFIDWVELVSPTIDQCKNVVANLTPKHSSVHIRECSPEVILFLLPELLNHPAVKNLRIYMLHTQLTHNCLKCLSDLLVDNKTLQMLTLSDSSITDAGVGLITEALEKNSCLTHLDLRFNPNITSFSSRYIAPLLCKNTTLKEMYLFGSSISYDGILDIIYALQINNHLQKVFLDKQHKFSLCNDSNYEAYKHRVKFF